MSANELNKEKLNRAGLNREEQASMDLLKAMGELYCRSGQPKRGLVMLLIAVHLSPRDPMLLRNLAVAFTDSGQPERALNALDQVQAAEGPAPDLLLLRSRALWAAARKDEARECFNTYLTARRAAQ